MLCAEVELIYSDGIHSGKHLRGYFPADHDVPLSLRSTEPVQRMTTPKTRFVLETRPTLVKRALHFAFYLCPCAYLVLESSVRCMSSVDRTLLKLPMHQPSQKARDGPIRATSAVE